MNLLENTNTLSPEQYISVRTQLALFFGSFLTGLPAGLLFDFFRTLRALLPHHVLTVFLEDVLWSFLWFFFLQCYVWMYADSAFRWQYAAGAAVGTLLYLLTIGAVWKRILRRFRGVRAALHHAVKRAAELPKHMKSAKKCEKST